MMMKVKEFIKELRKYNPNADVDTGNATAYLTQAKIDSEVRGHWYGGKFLDSEKKNLKIVHTVIIWGDE
jgi:hypothetical protein